MPEESGLDFLRELKAQPSSPAVIMVTAYGSEKIAVEAMKSGAYDYLPKPFDRMSFGWWWSARSTTWHWRKKTCA